MRHNQILLSAGGLMLMCHSAFAACTLETVRGTWAWQSHGSVMMILPGSSTAVPVPFASMGIMKVGDGGRYTAHATISVGGQVQEADLTGSIDVHADCTATETCTGAIPCADKVMILNSNEKRWIPTQHPLGPVIGAAVFRRMSPGEPWCTSEMVHGQYGGSGEGTYMTLIPGQAQPVPAPFSGIFSLSFQHGEGGAGVATASLAGTNVEVAFPKISMVVNRDCTATMSYSGARSKQFPGQAFSGTIRYIVLNYGYELLGMEIQSSVGLPIELENHKRISMTPVASEP